MYKEVFTVCKQFTLGVYMGRRRSAWVGLSGFLGLLTVWGCSLWFVYSEYGL